MTVVLVHPIKNALMVQRVMDFFNLPFIWFLSFFVLVDRNACAAA
jgi:hypothetical protein